VIGRMEGVARRVFGTVVAAQLVLVAAAAGQGAGPASTPPSILGYWHGRSTCIKAPWNAACNDEEVLYHFVPAADPPGQVLLKAYKYVNGAPESMYDLQFAWDSTRHRWAARYSNSRVRILWSYTVEDSVLIGRLVDLPDERLVRNVLVTLVADSTRRPGGP